VIYKNRQLHGPKCKKWCIEMKYSNKTPNWGVTNLWPISWTNVWWSEIVNWHLLASIRNPTMQILKIRAVVTFWSIVLKRWKGTSIKCLKKLLTVKEIQHIWKSQIIEISIFISTLAIKRTILHDIVSFI